MSQSITRSYVNYVEVASNPFLERLFTYGFSTLLPQFVLTIIINAKALYLCLSRHSAVTKIKYAMLKPVWLSTSLKFRQGPILEDSKLESN